MEIQTKRERILSIVDTLQAAREAIESLWGRTKKSIISYTLSAIGVLFITLMAMSALKSGLNTTLIGLLAGVAHAAIRYAISELEREESATECVDLRFGIPRHV